MNRFMFKSTITALVLGFLVLLTTASCTNKRAEIGSAENPIKLFFVPSVDVKVIEDNSKVIKAYLEANTPYKFEIAIPASFIAVVEAFGTKRADVAAINTFGYLLAYDKYGAQAGLTVIRHGSSTYQAQFVAKEGGKINSLDDIAGKKIAFVDPASMSGYLLPLKILREKNIKPSEEVFAMRHDSVISMIYQGQVDVGATFYSPAHEGKIQDARRLVLTQYPDVEKKIKVVSLTESLPNDPIIFRKDLPEEIKTKLTETFLAFIKTPEGKAAFDSIYGASDFKKATDADYAGVRDMLKTLGKSAQEFMK
ncbi:MAG: phosphate/phosphite/phosphonate ABC transporter substrate-binding protein [Pseudobdellovibrionaceae bacterium]